MNRVGFVVSLIALIGSSVVFAAVAYKVSRDAKVGAVGHGSEAVVDPEYQKLPPDSQSDWLTDFTLTERSGKTVRWSELAGKVRVVSFFFSSCPANCLRQNMQVRDVEQAYLGKKVVCVSITCDPDIDSPERLAEYAVKLNATPDQWLFLTGKLIYIRRVAGELFGVALDKQTHTERLIVCDKWGRIRGTFIWNKVDEMAQLRLLVDKLLDETEPLAAEATEGK
jgi:cytochrome oxidase Cu insertion factor (SCO1/SenC/PrrC family)